MKTIIDEQLHALLYAFYQDVMQFELSPHFDAKASYSGRKAKELEEIKQKYQVAIDHLRLDKGSLEMPTGSCPGKTRGNLGANSPVQRLPDELEQWERCTRYGRADLTLHPLVRDAYKVACLIERCGASEALTRASCAAFELCEALSDYARHSNELEELVEQFQDGHTPSEET